MTEPLLRIESLAGGYGATRILHGLDLSVGSDGVTALLGANGAGKTTLMKTLAGVLPASSGRIFFRGEEITGRNAAERVLAGIVLVPEGRLVFPDLSVHENLRLGAVNRRARAGWRGALRGGAGDLPEAARTPPPGRGHALGRRAADAGDRPRPDGTPLADVARRADARPRPGGGAAHVRADPHPRRVDHPAGRRAGRAAHARRRAPRLRDRERPCRSRGRRRRTGGRGRRSARPTWASERPPCAFIAFPEPPRSPSTSPAMAAASSCSSCTASAATATTGARSSPAFAAGLLLRRLGRARLRRLRRLRGPARLRGFHLRRSARARHFSSRRAHLVGLSIGGRIARTSRSRIRNACAR